MMEREPSRRPTIQDVCANPVLARTQAIMNRNLANARATVASGHGDAQSVFRASAFGSEPTSFLAEINPSSVDVEMDIS